ncbi:MAG: DNA adenine methylase [Methanomicrobiales archaeon]|jgi:DNA adenine methylase|nr:DNA adenine methylase [Methanomicrobiales archaeon]
MPVTLSPLRYPGGKTKLYDYVKKLLEFNGLSTKTTYVEPFAGGAGLAIKLLLSGDVERIIINDLDPAVYSFWKSILEYTDAFCEKIENIDITPDEWNRQRKIYSEGNTDDILALGFATFFLNRTNVSGIIRGGLIGGVNQTGSHKMDARFHKRNLTKKICSIAKYKENIVVYNMDARDLLQGLENEKPGNIFINLDPPYIKKGKCLYSDFLEEQGHEILAKSVSQCRHKWIVTYDVCSLAERLYSQYRYGYLDLTYSIQKIKAGREYIFFSDNLSIPDSYTFFPACCVRNCKLMN